MNYWLWKTWAIVISSYAFFIRYIFWSTCFVRYHHHQQLLTINVHIYKIKYTTKQWKKASNKDCNIDSREESRTLSPALALSTWKKAIPTLYFCNLWSRFLLWSILDFSGDEDLQCSLLNLPGQWQAPLTLSLLKRFCQRNFAPATGI